MLSTETLCTCLSISGLLHGVWLKDQAKGPSGETTRFAVVRKTSKPVLALVLTRFPTNVLVPTVAVWLAWLGFTCVAVHFGVLLHFLSNDRLSAVKLS